MEKVVSPTARIHSAGIGSSARVESGMRCSNGNERWYGVAVATGASVWILGALVTAVRLASAQKTDSLERQVQLTEKGIAGNHSNADATDRGIGTTHSKDEGTRGQ